MSDVRPDPTSTYELQTHLAGDHHDNRPAAAWVDLVRLHDHAHERHDPGHTHEKGR